MTTFSVLLDLVGRSSELPSWVLDDVVDLGVRAEQLGFDRIWLRAESTAETVFFAEALLGRTRAIGVGLVVPARPDGLPRRQARRGDDLAQPSRRELVVGLVARSSRLKVAAFAGMEGLYLLCSRAESSLLLRADRAFRDGAALRQPHTEGPRHVSLIWPETDLDALSPAGVRAEIGHQLAVLDESVEIVFEPAAVTVSAGLAAKTMERWSREVLPYFRPLPLAEPPTFA